MIYRLRTMLFVPAIRKSKNSFSFIFQIRSQKKRCKNIRMEDACVSVSVTQKDQRYGKIKCESVFRICANPARSWWIRLITDLNKTHKILIKIFFIFLNYAQMLTFCFMIVAVEVIYIWNTKNTNFHVN